MKVRWLAAVVLSLLWGAAAQAHGHKVHVSGTIEKVSSDSIQVKTRDGKSVEIKLVASTVYRWHDTEKPIKPDSNTDKPAKASDLAAGDLVVIHATPKGNELEADEVKFTVPIAGKMATPPAQKQQR